MPEEPVTLFTIAAGAAAELFDRELMAVAENILDLNTEAEKVREITLKFKIKPDANRGFGMVSIDVTSKTGPTRGVGTTFFFGRRGGKAFVAENSPKQPSLFEEQKPKPVAQFRNGDRE